MGSISLGTVLALLGCIMQPKNLFAVVFITGSLGLGALVACGKGTDAVVAKDPSAVGVTSGAEGANGAAAGKDKAAGATTPDTKGAMGGGSDRALGGDTPKGGVAATATHPTGPAPGNTGDPPPDPNKK